MNSRDRICLKRIVCYVIVAVMISMIYLSSCDENVVTADVPNANIEVPNDVSADESSVNMPTEISGRASRDVVNIDGVSEIEGDVEIPLDEPNADERAALIEKYRLSEEVYEEYKKSWQRPIYGGQFNGIPLDEFIEIMNEPDAEERAKIIKNYRLSEEAYEGYKKAWQRPEEQRGIMPLDEYIGMMEGQRISHETMRITPLVDVDEFGDTEPTVVEVLDGVDVNALCLMKLGEAIDTLGPEHSIPAYYSKWPGESIVYKGSCILVYYDGDLRKNEAGDFAPQLDLEEDIDAIIIRQEVDVYKGIGVDKTLNEIKQAPDFLKKLGEPFSKKYKELTLEGYYEYKGTLIKMTMFFDDNNYCAEVMLQPIKIPRI